MTVPAGWLELPWVRRACVRRAEARCARYVRMQAYLQGDVPSGQIWLQLLMQHPSALLELRHVEPDQVEERLANARLELQALRAGAPLPDGPLPVRPQRALALAAADLEWALREVRALERLRLSLFRRGPENGTAPADPDRIVAAYRARERPDPIEPLSPEDVDSVLAIPRKDRIRVFSRWAEARAGASGLEEALFGPAEGGDTGRVRVGRLSELPESAPVRADMDGEPVVVVREGGQVRAMEGICPHRGGDLTEGRVQGGTIECPIHGWCFRLDDGTEVRGRGRPLRRIPTEVERDVVFLRRE